MLAKILIQTNEICVLSCSPAAFSDRAHQLRVWLNDVLDGKSYGSSAPIADASSRRYLRLETDETTYVVMDAPDQMQVLDRFVRIAQRLRQIGVEVPRVLAREQKHGFLLLSDLGQQSYLDVLDDHNAECLYRAALDGLIRIQTKAAFDELPDYDDAFLRIEMEMFIEWFLSRHLGLELDAAGRQIFDEAFGVLLDSAARQPRCFVHRDYHSRNLMISSNTGPGVLDFQDAVHGPLTYDLVSLLRDVYIAWPQKRVAQWAHHYYELALQHGLLEIGYEEFLTWFDLMGVQRHLKIPGIFSRLYYRDGKPNYLSDIPVALNYLTEVTGKYEDLGRLHRLLQSMDLEVRTHSHTREALT